MVLFSRWRTAALFCFTLFTLSTLQSQGWKPPVVNVFVSPLGQDTWSGLLPAPNKTQTDGPFRTFDHARLYVQSLDKTHLSLINVFFRAGVYNQAQPETFQIADSGSAQTQIVYQNFPGEEAVISGGMRVTGWTNTTGNTWVTYLQTGTAPFENLYYNGQRRLRPRLGNYLGTSDDASPLWDRVDHPYYACAASNACNSPNTQTSSCIDANGQKQNMPGYECFDRFYFDPQNTNGNDPFPIQANWKNLQPQPGNPCGAAVGNTQQAGDIELLIFEQFNTSKLHVNCVDAVNDVIYLNGTTTGPKSTVNSPPQQPQEVDFSKGSRYIVENVEDALTLPGQWFLDVSATPQWKLTYLANPNENPNQDLVIVPQASPVLVADQLSYVTFRGLIFEYDNYVVPAGGHSSKEGEPDIQSAVSFENSSNITWDGNVVRHTAGGGLDFMSCLGVESPSWCLNPNAGATDAQNEIVNSQFYDLGVQGIRIGDTYNAKDSATNVPQQFWVANNVVEGYGRVIPASFGITQGNGHHNTYTHNDVYDGYHCAISLVETAGVADPPNGLGVAYNTISFNHVHNLLQGIMNDGGSIRVESGNTFSDPPGNVIENNKIHDVTDASILDPGGYGGNGIYLDNGTSNVTVQNNLVYRVSDNAVYTPHGAAVAGAPNIVRNNILAFARNGMLAVDDPYKGENGPPWISNLNFEFTNNLMYFDRPLNLNPTQTDSSFSAVTDCTYTGSSSPGNFGNFEMLDWNVYWRTDQKFASDANAFHVQVTPGQPTDKQYPCVRPTAAVYSDFDWYTFAQWGAATGQDLHSKVKNPYFVAPQYPFDDYRLLFGAPIAGFVPFDPNQAGRTIPFVWFVPPAVAPTFTTQTYNPATDF
jgi:hypothetical protein